MIVVPNVNPHTEPEELPTVATPGFELVHEPPATGFVNVTQLPWHTTVLPDMVPGEDTTVTMVVL